MQLQLPHYLAIGGAAVLLVAFLIYLFAGPKAKVPATVIGVVAGLVLGAGAGMLLMFQFGYSLERPDPTARLGIDPGRNAASWAPPKGLGGPPPMKPPEGMKMPEGMDKWQGPGARFGGKPQGDAKPAEQAKPEAPKP